MADHVAALAAGNPSLAFHICTVLASPLLDIMNIQGGGFHFNGNSRAGKSTALKMAGSVFGKPDANGQIKSWRSTDNSLEAIAEQSNDQTLLLDEISQCDNAKIIGQAAYMLANGQGKGRANQRGDAREIKTFRVLFISNGERTLENMMDAEDARSVKNAGIGVRMPNVPMGELAKHFNLHGFVNIKALMDSIPDRIMSDYGHAGKAFLSYLVEMRSADEGALKDFINDLMKQFTKLALPSGSDPQVASICQRFALVAAAGELAIECRILPWQAGEAINMTKICFDACISVRDAGIGGGEEFKAIDLIRNYVQVHSANFQWASNTSSPPLLCHGYKDDNYFFFNAEGFKVACSGMDTRQVAKALHTAGFLDKDKGERNFNKQNRKLKGRYFHVNASIINDADISNEDDADITRSAGRFAAKPILTSHAIPAPLNLVQETEDDSAIIKHLWAKMEFQKARGLL